MTKRDLPELLRIQAATLEAKGIAPEVELLREAADEIDGLRHSVADAIEQIAAIQKMSP